MLSYPDPKTDPVRCYKQFAGDIEGVTALTILENCTAQHWLQLRSMEIVGDIASALEFPDPIEDDFPELVQAFTKCFDLIAATEDKDVNEHHQAVTDAFKPVRSVILRFWEDTKRLSKLSVTNPKREKYRLLVHNFFRSLIPLAKESGPDRSDIEDAFLGDEDEAFKFGCGELLMEGVLLGSYAIELVTEIWIFAPDAATRDQSFAVREALAECDIADSWGMSMPQYITSCNPQKLGRQLSQIITSREGNVESQIECLSLHLDLARERSKSVSISTNLWRDAIYQLGVFADPVWQGKDTSYGTMVSAVNHANSLFHTALTTSSTPLQLLIEVLTNMDGTKIMADVALMGAKRWISFPCEYVATTSAASSSPSLFLLPTVVHFAGPKKNRSSDQQELLALFAKKLRPFWYPTLKQLRAVDKAVNPAANAAITAWSSIAELVGVHTIVKVLVGCCRIGCPEFILRSERWMAVCTRCRLVQYCGEECQKIDWKKHRPLCKATSDETEKTAT